MRRCKLITRVPRGADSWARTEVRSREAPGPNRTDPTRITTSREGTTDLRRIKDATPKGPKWSHLGTLSINPTAPLNYRISKEALLGRITRNMDKPMLIQKSWPEIRSISRSRTRRRKTSTSKSMEASPNRSTKIRKTVPFSVPPTIIFLRVATNFDNFLPHLRHIVNITDLNTWEVQSMSRITFDVRFECSVTPFTPNKCEMPHWSSSEWTSFS